METICLDCKADIPKTRKTCHMCKGRNMVSGNGLSIVADLVVCKCGCVEFKTTMHINANPNYITSKQCAKCGASISVNIYYKSPYMD